MQLYFWLFVSPVCFVVWADGVPKPLAFVVRFGFGTSNVLSKAPPEGLKFRRSLDLREIPTSKAHTRQVKVRGYWTKL